MRLVKARTSTSGLTTPPPEPALPSVPVPKPDLDLGRVLDCTVDHYPWDDWERWALAQGLEPKLAGLARLVIREAFQHDWPMWLRGVTGWADDGQGMLDLALREPQVAHERWDVLLRTDGFRGDYHPRAREWTWGYLRPSARRLCRELVASCDASHS
jgi:hypothetical protein